MSEEKMSESKSTSPDELTKTKKKSDVELTEQDLQNVSGGGGGVLSVSTTVPNLEQALKVTPGGAPAPKGWDLTNQKPG
jgi:hypothetical protein